MEIKKFVLNRGELCPFVDCEFRKDNVAGMCCGAQAGRNHAFVCDLEALKKLYNTHKK